MKAKAKELKQSEQQRTLKRSRCANLMWKHYVQTRYVSVYTVRDRLLALKRHAVRCLGGIWERVREQLQQDARVILCTIGASSRLVNELEHSPRVHTAILDEAGATSEVAIPLLLRLDPVPAESGARGRPLAAATCCNWRPEQ